jgi:hypothetical protein
VRNEQNEPSAKNCPRCRLVNPSEAERCDCGWDFLTQRQETSYLRKAMPITAGVSAATVVLIVVVKLVYLLLRLAVEHN